MNYSAYVAYKGTSGTLSAEEYRNLSSSSNPQVVQNSSVPVDPSSQVEEMASEQVDSYMESNTYQYADTPRGSEMDRWATMGLINHVMKDQYFDSTFNKARVDGGREELSGRVNGLMGQIKNVHVLSEIPVLESWVDALTKSLTAVDTEDAPTGEDGEGSEGTTVDVGDVVDDGSSAPDGAVVDVGDVVDDGSGLPDDTITDVIDNNDIA